MGNGIGKSITLFADGLNAGVIMGATSPIVLVSRSDSYESKYYSILLGAVISQYYRNNYMEKIMYKILATKSVQLY